MMRARRAALLAATIPVLGWPVVAASQTLQPAVAAADSADPRPEVSVFAGGAVRDVAGAETADANVSGSLGLRYQGRVWVVTGLVNVAGTEDTIRSSYGQTLLAPASGKALNAGLLDIRARRLPLLSDSAQCKLNPHAIACHIGVHAYLSASSALWATAFDSANVVQGTELVPSWGLGLGVSYTFFNARLVDGTEAGMVLDVGLATRHLRGDLTDDDSARSALLGTDKTSYVGFEAGLSLQYNTLQGGITYYRMGGDLDGFSRGQVVAGFSILANLNSSRLPR